MMPDLVVIGGGAAGLGAARAAVRTGARVLLVSDGQPGGDCTFYGCVPSKTLIESAARGMPYAQAAQRIRDVVAQIAATESADALRDEGIDVRLGRAVFTGPGRLAVNGRRVDAARVVIATGSRPAVPPLAGSDRISYLSNETVFDLTEPPESLVILGGGATGCELAQAFARFGTRVTVLEASAGLLPHEEPEAATVVADVFARERIEVRTGAEADKVQEAPTGVQIALTSGEIVEAERLLVAVGRAPATDGLGLDAAGVRVDQRGRVATDDRLATSAAGVYAAGDVTGRLPFTHAAFAMGRLAATNALGRRKRRYRPGATPWVTFTDPEVARVGITEAEAARHGGTVAHLPMSEVDRALAAGATDGFVKLIAGPRPVLRTIGGGAGTRRHHRRATRRRDDP